MVGEIFVFSSNVNWKLGRKLAVFLFPVLMTFP